MNTKKPIHLLCSALLVSAGLVSAVSAAPIALPGGPVVINFNNHEQISASNSIVAPSGAKEGNWGIFTVNTIYKGGAIPATQLFGTSGPPIFADSLSGQITGIFWGIRTITPGCPTCFDAAGGHLDLWWDNPSAVGGTFADLGIATPAQRTGDSTFTNFTDGTFLARVDFASGIDPTNSSVDIRGSVVPAAGGFVGVADSFANVDLTAGGAWATALDTNFFNTAFGQRDIRFHNGYNDFIPWLGPTGTDVLGAVSSDPARAFAVPEPGSLALIGLALAGLGFMRRRWGT